MLKFLDLPTDLTLQVFSLFKSPPVIQKNGLYNSHEPTWDGLATLQASRLTCRALNELVSGMICPFFHGGLNKKTMERIENLSRNPLIADGIRAVELDLSFRPKTNATDLERYCDFVTAKIDSFAGSCHYHTEIWDYEDEDQSDDANKHRTWLAAGNKFWKIRDSWRNCVESRKMTSCTRDVDDSHQQLLKKCFAEYCSLQQAEEDIVGDGSFVSAVASATSRFKHPVFLSFVDNAGARSKDPVEVAWDETLLSSEMLEPHGWLDAEDPKIETDLLPARILVDLPIACYELETPIQGLHIGCFPLKQSFASLVPHSSGDLTGTWIHLASACYSLKSFQLGRRGMNNTPYRERPISEEDCTIIDEYFGAACSGPELASVDFSMSPFRVSGKMWAPNDFEAADSHYRASAILRKLRSWSLTRVHISSVEISDVDLELLVSRISRSNLKSINLSSIDLDKGLFANSIETLRLRKRESKDCDVSLSTIYGGARSAG